MALDLFKILCTQNTYTQSLVHLYHGKLSTADVTKMSLTWETWSNVCLAAAKVVWVVLVVQ